MTQPDWYHTLERITGRRPTGHAPLSGGCVAPVYRVDFAKAEPLVVKIGDPGTRGLELEGEMLIYLADNSSLPVPRVVHKSNALLIMAHVDGGDALTGPAQSHAAELLGALHAVSRPQYGFHTATVIGGLAQPNPWTESWIAFFRDHRLLYMARQCLESGHLSAREMGRIEALAQKLDTLLEEPEAPSLIHGDLWGGNVLARAGRITGFVDPAIYYASAEIELAFSTLFGTFGDGFFDRYKEYRPIAPGFFEVRLDIYNLWHLLTHVRLFGRSYWSGIDRTLVRHGV